MKFEDLDYRMREIEKSIDTYMSGDCIWCARLDGRGFSKFTQENFEKPYDIRFSDLMVETTKHLMQCGFNFVFGFTQSDEISLLFHRNASSYNGKIRKLISILAGEASGFFSVKAGMPVCFDCRMIQLMTSKDIIDYFSWRQSDLLRNSLDSYCYYALLKDGQNGAAAAGLLSDKQPEYKKELLKKYSVDYDTIPDWQKYGIAVYFVTIDKQGTNKKTGESVIFTRRVISSDRQLPYGKDFGEYALRFYNIT